MIIGMMMARNEESRTLEREYNIFRKSLDGLCELCDFVYCLDDASTDNTAEAMIRTNTKVIHNEKQMFTVNEASNRQKLWNIATENASNGDWIVNLDGDQVLTFVDYLKHIMHKFDDAYGISVRLYDMWSMTHYRSDQFWSAHKGNWMLAVKYDDKIEYRWHDTPIHCGHFPVNATPVYTTTEIPLIHYGWALEEDRLEKYKRYTELDPDGAYGSIHQYLSILNKEPNLIKLEVDV